MKPTEILSEEHKSIMAMLEVVRVICEKIQQGQKIPVEHLQQIVSFIRGYADQYHHAKEEDLLFKEMALAGIPQDGGPIGVMLHDHTEGRQYTGAMRDAVDDLKNQKVEACQKFVENAQKYVALLREHIYKEDHILYPMADMHLSSEQQSKLKAEFDQVEKASDQHKEFIKILKLLQKIYGS